MNRKERTRILVEGSRKVLSRMACEAEQLYAVAMVREPTEELVMLKVREGAQCSLFYLGEALMTSVRSSHRWRPWLRHGAGRGPQESP